MVSSLEQYGRLYVKLERQPARLGLSLAVKSYLGRVALVHDGLAELFQDDKVRELDADVVRHDMAEVAVLERLIEANNELARALMHARGIGQGLYPEAAYILEQMSIEKERTLG